MTSITARHINKIGAERQCTVFGYIRKMESKLFGSFHSNSYYHIPSGIIFICILFYGNGVPELFEYIVDDICKQLKKQRIWIIDDSIWKYVDIVTMHKTVKEQDIGCIDWRPFIAKTIKQHLIADGMFIEPDYIAIFLKHYELSLYELSLRSVGLSDLSDLKLLNEQSIRSICKEVNMCWNHEIYKFIKACKDLKENRYPPKRMEVDLWLQLYCLSKYTSILKENGLSDLTDIDQLNDQEIGLLADECSMGVLHKKKFVAACLEYKQKEETKIEQEGCYIM